MNRLERASCKHRKAMLEALHERKSLERQVDWHLLCRMLRSLRRELGLKKTAE